MVTFTVGSLCTGYGGLELAAEAMFGDVDVRFVSDIDSALDAFYDRRYPGVPNVGDITADPDLEPVDIVTAGFPCQPFSTAGHKKGTDDVRFIWPHIAAAIGRMDPRPRLLLLENVPGLLTTNGGDAMARVVSDLAGLGYMGSYGLARASDVGACHQRRRLFIAAWSADTPRPGPQGSRPEVDPRQGASTPGERGNVEPPRRDPRPRCPTPHPDSDRDGTEVHAADDRRRDRPDETPLPVREGHVHPTHPLKDRGGTIPTPRAADATSGPDHARVDRRATHGSGGDDLTTFVDKRLNPDTWHHYTQAITLHTQTIGRPPPPPNLENTRLLNPAFVEWMMMLPPGWVTHPDIALTRTQALRILGNGVVPPQATHAYTQLLTGRTKP